MDSMSTLLLFSVTNKEHVEMFPSTSTNPDPNFFLVNFNYQILLIYGFPGNSEIDTIEIEFRLIYSGNLATLGARERKEDSRNRERKSGRKEKVNGNSYHIVMIYHSDVGAGVTAGADLGRQMSQLPPVVELVQACLDDQWWPLTQIGFLGRRILGGLHVLTFLLLLGLRRG